MDERAAALQELVRRGRLSMDDPHVQELARRGLIQAEAPKQGPGFLRGLTDAAVQGATLGFSDEAGAFGGAIGDKIGGFVRGDGRASVPFGQLYDQNLERQRADLSTFANENPGTALTANVVGSMAAAPANVAGALASAPTLVNAMKTGAKVGGAFGAATGFGTGEGGAIPRLQNAALYGGVGAGLGATIPVAGEAIGRGAAKVGDILGLGNADDAAKALVLRALTRDGMMPEDLARNYANALSEGGQQKIIGLPGMAPSGVQSVVADIGAKKPISLTDVGGRNLQRLARFAESTPGNATDQAAKFFGTRNAEQGMRIANDVAELVHPNVDFHGSIEALDAARKASAAPAYEAAFAKDMGMGPGVIWSDKLGNLMQRPSMQAAWKNAQRIAADEGVALPEFIKMADDGTMQIVKAPDMQAWHYIKRGLADVVESAKNPAGKITTDAGRATNNLLRDLKDELFTLNPEYAGANRAYAGASANKDALEAGRSVLSRAEFSDPKTVAKAFNELGDTEKEFFRAGVAQAIRDSLENTRDGANATLKFFSTPALRERIRAVFPDDKAFKAFETRVMREGEMFKTGSFVMGGSPTARINADQADAGGLVGMALDGATGNVTGMARKAVMDTLAKRWQGVSADRADALAPMLFNGQQGANQATITGLLDFAADRARRAQNSNQVLTGLLAPVSAQPALLGSRR